MPCEEIKLNLFVLAVSRVKFINIFIFLNSNKQISQTGENVATN